MVTEAAGELSAEEKNWAMACHLAALGAFVFPFGGIIGPLVIWLLKRDHMPFVDDQGKEALNFQITMMIAGFVCILLMLVVIGVLLIFPLIIFDVVMIIVAAVKASEGVRYRYPIAFRLINQNPSQNSA